MTQRFPDTTACRHAARPGTLRQPARENDARRFAIEEQRADQNHRAYRDQPADEKAGEDGRRNRHPRRQHPGARRNRRRCCRLGRGRRSADHDRRNRRQHDGGGAAHGARPAQAFGRRHCRRGGGDGRTNVRQQRRQGGDRYRAARSHRPRQGAAAARVARRQAPRPYSIARGHRLRRCRGRFARGARAPQRRLCHLQDQSRRRYARSRRRANAGYLPRARQGLPQFCRCQSGLERGGGRPLRACGRRLRLRLFRAASLGPRSRRHGENSRSEPLC